MREPDKSRNSGWWRLRAACTALGRDRDGSALFYTTISLPVLVGFALLAIDGSRLMNLHSHLQHGADGLALAAAGELNDKDDSLERAKLAIQKLIKNNQRFGDAGAAIIECPSDDDCDVTARFLTSLPPDDATLISDWVAEKPSRLVAELSEDLENHPRSDEARFVEIIVKPQGLTTLMPAAFIGGSDTAAASAVAVAGYTEGVCHFTPMMMCNPFEDDDPDTPDLYEMAARTDFRRKMIEIRQVTGNSEYFPGNFGFVRSPYYGDGADDLRESLARTDPDNCSNEDGVDTKPGQNMGPVSQGLNVRFDIYHSPLHSKRNDPAYRPARNVRKGYGGNAGTNPGPAECKTSSLEDGINYQGFPRDRTVDQELSSGGRIWMGDWDFDTYWNVNFNHGDVPIAPPNHPTEEGEPEVPWSTANPPSRYEVYRYEIENDLLENESVGGEIGAPMCYAGGGLSDEPDRRIIHAAIINCKAEGDLEPDGQLNGAEENVGVYAFAKFFLIRPLDEEGSDTIDLELVDVVSPPTDYQARDTVQLFR